MKILSVFENFKKHGVSATFFYLCCIVLIYLTIQFFDPATYNATVRRERAQKRYSEISQGKSTNTLTESDYSGMQSEMDDIQDAEKSPIGGYLAGIIICVGVCFFTYRVLDRKKNNQFS